MARTKIFTDGSYSPSSCDTNCGGIGIFIEHKEMKDLSLHVHGNNLNIILIEALAIRSALIVYFELQRINIYTDNAHCYDNLIKFRDNYKESTWLTSSKSLIAEFDILIHCLELTKRRTDLGKSTMFYKVKAHSGNYGNDNAHSLANKGRNNNTQVQSTVNLTIDVPSHRSNSVAQVIHSLIPQVNLLIDQFNMNKKTKGKQKLSMQTNPELEPNTLTNNIVSPIVSITESVPATISTSEDKYYNGTIFTFCILCTRIVRTVHIDYCSTVFNTVGNINLPQVLIVYCKTCNLLPNVYDINGSINGLISTLLISTSPIFNLLSMVYKTKMNIVQSNNALVSMSISQVTDKCSMNCWCDSIDTNTGITLSRLNAGFMY